MFSTVLFAALAGSAAAAPIVQRAAPSAWATDYLEDYDTYHERYIALNCHDKHDTTFFDDCCHPLLSSENMSDNRKAYCTPSTTESASAATVSATSTDDGASQAFTNATASVESVYESVVATATAEVTSITLSTSSIASETASSTAVIGDNQWAKNKKVSTSSAAPTTTSSTQEWTWTATSTSTAAAKTTAASSSSSGSYSNTGGYATYFYQGGNAGECGTVHSDSDYVIAIDSNGWWSDYQSNSNSPYCGKSINIKNTNNGNTITATVADVCPTCTNNNSLDLSVAAFSALADGDMGAGMLPISWSFA